MKRSICLLLLNVALVRFAATSAQAQSLYSFAGLQTTLTTNATTIQTNCSAYQLHAGKGLMITISVTSPQVITNALTFNLQGADESRTNWGTSNFASITVTNSGGSTAVVTTNFPGSVFNNYSVFRVGSITTPNVTNTYVLNFVTVNSTEYGPP